MKKEKLILTDVDGVLLEWRSAFDRFMATKGVVPVMEKQEHFDLEHFYGIPRKDVYEEVDNFNSGHWEFGTLTPHSELGAVEGVKYLNEVLGYRFIAITSCSSKAQAVALRKANLYNVFGDVFDAVHCVDVGEPKNTHLADYEPTFWIEDKPSGCLAGVEYGHDCLLMTQEFNKNEVDDRWTRCYNWGDIVKYVLNNQ